MIKSKYYVLLTLSLFISFNLGSDVLLRSAEAKESQSAQNVRDDYDRGVVLYRTGKLDASQSAFKNYLERHPNHRPTLQWLSLLDTRLSQNGASQFMVEQMPHLPRITHFNPSLEAALAGHTPPTLPANIPEELSAIRQKYAESQKELELRREQIQRSLSQTQHAINQSKEAEELNKGFTRKIDLLQNEILALKESIKEKETALLNSQARVQKLVSEKTDDSANQRQSSEELKQASAKHLADLEKRNTQVKDLHTALELKEKDVTQLRQLLKELRAEMSEKQTSHELIVQKNLSDIRKLDTKLAAKVSAASEIHQETTDLKTSLSRANTEISTARKSISDLESQMDQLKSRHAAELDKASKTTADLKSQMDQLKSRHAVELDKASKNTADLKSQMDQLKSRHAAEITQAQATARHDADTELAGLKDDITQAQASWKKELDARTVQLEESRMNLERVVKSLDEERNNASEQKDERAKLNRQFGTDKAALQNEIDERKGQVLRAMEQTRLVIVESDARQARIRELEGVIASQKKEFASLSETAKSSDQRVSEIQNQFNQQIADLKIKTLEQTKLLAARNQEIEPLKQSNQNLTKENQNIRIQLEKQSKILADKSAQLQEINRDNSDLREQIAELKREAVGLEQEVAVLTKGRQHLADRFRKSETDLLESEKQLLQMKSVFDADRQESQARISGLELKLQNKIETQSMENKMALVNKISNLRGENNDLDTQNKRLHEELAGLRRRIVDNDKTAQTRIDDLDNALSNTRRILSEVSSSYQSTEEKRLQTDQLMVNLVKEQHALKTENSSLAQMNVEYKNDLAVKNAEIKETRGMLEDVNLTLAGAQSEKEQLAKELAKERVLRDKIEGRIKQQLDQTLPQFESMSNSLEEMQRALKTAAE